MAAVTRAGRGPQQQRSLLLVATVCLLAAAAHVTPASAQQALPARPDAAEAPAMVGAELPSNLEPAISSVVGADGLAGQLLARYLSNAELAAWGADFVGRCGSIARRFSIGKSVSGADLWVIEIAARPGQADGRPNFKYVANMHGDEPGGRSLLPMLAEWLCANSASDARAVRIIQGMHLFLMPTMNPDGFARRQRYNAAGADLNRNFPSVFSVCAGQAPETCNPALLQHATGYTPQPETLAIMAWTLATPFTASANLHEGAIVANYPWDGYNDGSYANKGSPNLTPDTKEFKHLSEVYAAAHGFMSTSPSFRNGVTNGAQWYPIYGSMQDWDYTAADCMDITLELSQAKYPPTSYLRTMWADNVNALLALPITAVLGGVSGRVTDGSGAPVAGAVVSVAGISKSTRSRGATGYFNKPLAPGSYSVSVSAPGFRSKTQAVVVPANTTGAVANFVLARTSRRRASGQAAMVVPAAAQAAVAP